MPNVPTITPGADDTERTPEDATETIPLITNAHTDKQSGRTNDTVEISDEEAYAKLKAKRAERRRKSSSDAVLPPASWVPSRSLPLLQPFLSMCSHRALAVL